MASPSEAKFTVGQYVMRKDLTAAQKMEKTSLPPIFSERVGKYPWDRLTVVDVCSDDCGHVYLCCDERGCRMNLSEDRLREVDPSEKHGWRGE